MLFGPKPGFWSGYQGETSHSDVDILLIGVAGFAEIAKALYPCHEVLGREVNPKVFEKDVWAEMVRHGDGFVREIF